MRHFRAVINTIIASENIKNIRRRAARVVGGVSQYRDYFSYSSCTLRTYGYMSGMPSI